MTTPPKFKIGDTIYWYSNEEQRMHHAKVTFVNYVHIGNFYDDINYEVEIECCGKKKTMFIDENDALASEI
jgi:hypothetical protein